MSDLLPTTHHQLKKLGTFSCMSLVVNKMVGTGIFSTPSLIFELSGSVFNFLSLWLIGGIIIFCGLSVFLEFGLAMPYSGGEKNYLQRVYRNPKGLVSCVYAFQIVLLGFSSGNSYAFGKYVLFTLGYREDVDFEARIIGVLCITFAIWLHTKYPNRGTALFNILGLFKVLILVLIVGIGALAFVGVLNIPSQPSNFENIFEKYKPESGNLYSISVALLEIIYSFKGWENANYVLSEIEDPVKVLTISAPLAVLVTTALYFLVILSYLIIIPKAEFAQSGVLIAGIFFEKIFGASMASRILPIFISCSNLGNVLVVSFAHSRVNQELAKENYLPFSNKFTDIRYSLWLHWLVTVLVLVLPPSEGIYEFVVNLYIYPGTWINLLVTGGLLYLHWNAKAEHWGEYSLNSSYLQIQNYENYGSVPTSKDVSPNMSSENIVVDTAPFFQPNKGGSHITPIPKNSKLYHSNVILTLIFFLANVFLAIVPFIPPSQEYLTSHPSDIPYWCFPVTGTGVLVAGGLYWCYYRRVRHGVFHEE